MSMKYYEREEKCKYCGCLVKRYKICDNCIIDMLYEAYAQGKEPAMKHKTLAYRRGIEPLQIKAEAIEDAKGRIKNNSRCRTSVTLSEQ